MKQYKIVAGPQNLSLGKKVSVDSALNSSFGAIINAQAADGWTYHSMETITITEKPGCFQQPIPLNYYMLIFEKEA